MATFDIESGVTDEFSGSLWSEFVTMSRQAPVVHLELHTNDLSSARDLYGELCGWMPDRVDTRHGSYLALDMGRRLGGGIVESAAPRPIWLPYVEVGDIGAATDRALSLGAALLLAPREGPAGYRSVVSSPVGGQLAFWQQKSSR
jgi:predicted enzyme related to lactoylglutathione lyase